MSNQYLKGGRCNATQKDKENFKRVHPSVNGKIAKLCRIYQITYKNKTESPFRKHF